MNTQSKVGMSQARSATKAAAALGALAPEPSASKPIG